MPVVLLVRHGQASFGADDYDVLSEVGHEQAEVAGAELRRRGLTSPLLVCGTLRRQRETALGLGLGDELVVDGRWDEYDHLGLIERYPSASGEPADLSTSRGLQVRLDEALVSWAGDPDGGYEAFLDAGSAALAAVAGAGRDVVAVTSAGVVAAVCARLLGLGPEGFVALNRVGANAGITKVVVGRSGASLVSYNDHAHFEPDRRLLTYR